VVTFQKVLFSDSLLGDVHNKVTLKHEAGVPKLPVIINARYKQKFEPPQEHLGEVLLSTNPRVVADKAIKYYRGIFESATTYFNKSKA